MMQRDLKHGMVAKRANDKKDAYHSIKMVLNEIYGLDLHDSKKGDFRFPIYLGDRLKDVPIDALELSERGRNCLMRAGYTNLYTLLDKINSKADLLKIRCCGNGTAQEIIEKIFIYQFNILSEEKRTKFIKRIIELNMNDRDKECV